MAKQNLEYESGKAQKMSYIHRESMAGGKVYFTVKSVANDDSATDTTAVLKKDITSFTIGNTTAEWTLSDADMNLEPAKYYYDIVYENSASQSEPASFYGDFKIVKRVTNRNTAA